LTSNFFNLSRHTISFGTVISLFAIFNFDRHSLIIATNLALTNENCPSSQFSFKFQNHSTDEVENLERSCRHFELEFRAKRASPKERLRKPKDRLNGTRIPIVLSADGA
jgi:hypothetical protein